MLYRPRAPPPHTPEEDRQLLDLAPELAEEPLDELRLVEPLRTAALAPESRPAQAGSALRQNSTTAIQSQTGSARRKVLVRQTLGMCAIITPYPAEMAYGKVQRRWARRHSQPRRPVQNP